MQNETEKTLELGTQVSQAPLSFFLTTGTSVGIVGSGSLVFNLHMVQTQTEVGIFRPPNAQQRICPAQAGPGVHF